MIGISENAVLALCSALRTDIVVIATLMALFDGHLLLATSTIVIRFRKRYGSAEELFWYGSCHDAASSEDDGRAITAQGR